METAPLVSFVVNCYNGEQFLKEAINSIYTQTYSNWEIIFWDNASTDDSATIAQSYDKRLKYHLAHQTTPLGKARALAAGKARGKYLAFLDCDDLWLDSKLENQIEIFLRNDDVAIVYGRAEIFYENNNSKIIREGQILPEGMIFDQLVCEDFIPFPSAVIDRGKFIESGGFPEHYNHSTDYWIFLNLSYRYKVKALQEVCCKYRIHENNLSHLQHVICSEENIELVKSFLPDERAVVGLRYQYINLAISYVRDGDLTKALSTMFENGGWNILINRVMRKFYKVIKIIIISANGIFRLK